MTCSPVHKPIILYIEIYVNFPFFKNIIYIISINQLSNSHSPSRLERYKETFLLLQQISKLLD